MDPVTWLRELSKYNDPELAPNHPFFVRFSADLGYIYATDGYVLVISSIDLVPSLIKEPHPLSQTVYEKYVVKMQEAQEAARPIGVMDALALKELVGEPSWGAEALKELTDDDHPSVHIAGSHFTKPALARALAGWTAPLATAFLCHLFGDENAQALLLASEKMLVLCLPYRPIEGQLENVTALPAWALVEVKEGG